MADDEKPKTEAEEREHRQLRPYRRVVGAVFAIAISTMGVLTLRGIIRHLDRLPTVEALVTPAKVDVRALRACAEDLERLEARVRLTATRAFGAAPGVDESKPVEWEALARPLELERVSIVARCRLHEESADIVVGELETAANEIESLIRSYGLLHSRHLEDGYVHSRQTHRSLRRAAAALATRD